MIHGLALCAGVGGLELGLRLAIGDSYRTVCYVERDSFAASTLVARMEDEAMDSAPIWDDLESFDGTAWRGCVDIIAAGFPCQPWSAAGKREGADDDRWLWPTIWRVVRDVQPRWVFLENVPGLVRGGLGAVLADLSRGGFAAEWDVFSAQGVGAPHLRRRVFILADASSDRPQGVEPAGSAPGSVGRSGGTEVADPTGPRRGGREDTGAGSEDAGEGSRGIELERGGSELADTERHRLEGQSGSQPVGPGICRLFPPGPSDFNMWARVLQETPEVEPSLCGVADGVPDRLLDRSDRLRCLGNAVVPLVAATAFRALADRMT